MWHKFKSVLSKSEKGHLCVEKSIKIKRNYRLEFQYMSNFLIGMIMQ